MLIASTVVIWEGVRELISADARLTVADAFAGKLADAPYFSNYERFRDTFGSWRWATSTANQL